MGVKRRTYVFNPDTIRPAIEKFCLQISGNYPRHRGVFYPRFWVGLPGAPSPAATGYFANQPTENKNPRLSLGCDDNWRRERDSNPRWNFRPILAQQASAFSQLGHLSKKIFPKFFYIKLRSNFIGGGSRIRTHGGVTLNGFQDRRFQPLSHPSAKSLLCYHFAVSGSIHISLLEYQ